MPKTLKASEGIAPTSIVSEEVKRSQSGYYDFNTDPPALIKDGTKPFYGVEIIVDVKRGRKC